MWPLNIFRGWGRKSITNSLDLFREVYGAGRRSRSGKTVNINTAVEVSAVFACARVIGEGISQVPLKLIQVSADERTRLPARQHPLYDLLSYRPNFYQTSFEFRETLAWHVVLTGNFFCFKNVVLGKIRELLPFNPGSVTVLRADDGALTYRVTAPNGKSQDFPAESVWHVRGPSWNSWMGLDCVRHAREAIGLAMATEEQHSRMHANGLKASGVFSVEGKLGDDQYKQLKKWIDEEMDGLDNASKPMLLDRSASWTPYTLTGVDSQHLETRRYQVEEICRFFRVMPIMVGYSDKAATYASAEQMFLAHMVHTMSPWYQRLEQSIDANLLTEKDRQQGYYSNFVEEGMLRGSLKDTKDTILGYVNGGVITPNEGRAKLDMNPDPDPASDKLRIPANIVGEVPDPNDVPNENDTTSAVDPKGNDS